MIGNRTFVQASLCALFIACPAFAGPVSGIVFTKYGTSVQDGTAHASPTSATFYTQAENILIEPTTTQISLTATGVNATLTQSQNNAAALNYSANFASLAQADAAFPNGIPYTYTRVDGFYAGDTSAVTPPANVTPAAPLLSASSFSGIQGLNSGQANTLNFDAFTGPAGANSTKSVFIVNATTGGYQLSSTNLPAGTTSIGIAANTLAPSTQYQLQLVNDVLLRGTSLFEFSNATTVNFTTAAVPEPTTLAVLGAAGAMLVRRRRGA